MAQFALRSVRNRSMVSSVPETVLFLDQKPVSNEFSSVGLSHTSGETPYPVAVHTAGVCPKWEGGTFRKGTVEL